MSATRPFLKLVLAVFFIAGVSPVWSEQVTFQRAIELAAQHSPSVAVATADQMKAEQAYRELRNQYLPNLTLGSGIGWSYGYPLSIEGAAPSIFNVNYQSAIFNPSLSEFSKSAKLEWKAATKNAKDQRTEAILDTAITYIQLDKLAAEIKSLQDAETESNKLSSIVRQRVQQGVSSQVDLTKAELTAARVHMRLVEVEGNADLLRNHLSQLTGLAADSIETTTASIPKLPNMSADADQTTRALENSTALQVATEHAEAQRLRAKGEERTKYPQIDLSAQYGLFAKFNNYEEFFTKFQRNNATIGVGVRFSFVNFVQKARAEQAEAEAIKAKKQAEMVKNQVSSETLKLQRSIRQLSAAQKVAELEYQLAQSDLQATQIRAQTGTATSASTGQALAAATPSDVANAQIQATDKYSQYLETTFELEKAQLQLLRAIGELEPWALGQHP